MCIAQMTRLSAVVGGTVFYRFNAALKWLDLICEGTLSLHTYISISDLVLYVPMSPPGL